MATTRPKVLLAFSQYVRDRYLAPADLQRLESIADWDWFPCEGGGIYNSNDNPQAIEQIRQRLGDTDALVVCHGSPTINPDLMAAAPRLKMIGELEGDRFASRIDPEAAWERGIRMVDTTNGSSYPVSEWALGLILIALRNAGAYFRRLVDGDTRRDMSPTEYAGGMLTGKRVGFIGCGHMGRKLIKFMEPFDVETWVYDPYLPREMAEALGFTQTTLDNVLSHCQVIVCLVPHTPKTEKMIGERELNLIQPKAAFINVSRGAVVDSAALINRLKRGDITAGLDVFDPEPIPPDSEILHLPNVFLSPHIGYWTTDNYHHFSLMVDELERFFQGHETYFDLTPRTMANRRGNEPDTIPNKP